MTETPTAATWSTDDLTLFARAEQIDISTRRRDGSLRPFVPIWVVTLDGAPYVRCYRGPDGAWYRHASTNPDATVKTNGSQRDVTFAPANPANRDAIDAFDRVNSVNCAAKARVPSGTAPHWAGWSTGLGQRRHAHRTVRGDHLRSPGFTTSTANAPCS